MHGSVQAVCKCFFGDGGKGALPAGKTGVACWNAPGFPAQEAKGDRLSVPAGGAFPCQGRGAHSFLEKNPPHTPEEKHQGVSICPEPERHKGRGPRPPPLESTPWGKGRETRYSERPVRTADKIRKYSTGCAERCSSQNCIPAFGGAVFTGVQIGRPLM